MHFYLNADYISISYHDHIYILFVILCHQTVAFVCMKTKTHLRNDVIFKYSFKLHRNYYFLCYDFQNWPKKERGAHSVVGP